MVTEKIESFLKKVSQKEYHQALRWFLKEFSALFGDSDFSKIIEIENGPGKWDLAHYAIAQSVHGLMIRQLSFTPHCDGKGATRIEPICVAPYQESSSENHGELILAFIIGYPLKTAFSGKEGAPYSIREGENPIFVLHNVSQPSKSLMFCYK